jgi:hypothetical protein
MCPSWRSTQTSIWNCRYCGLRRKKKVWQFNVRSLVRSANFGSSICRSHHHHHHHGNHNHHLHSFKLLLLSLPRHEAFSSLTRLNSLLQEPLIIEDQDFRSSWSSHRRLPTLAKGSCDPHNPARVCLPGASLRARWTWSSPKLGSPLHVFGLSVTKIPT